MARVSLREDGNWVAQISKKMSIIIKSNGKKVPGRSKRLTGSELLITQPEYVEWDSSEESYPFVFESVGEWGVTTSIEPPEGFVANHDSLSSKVSDELEAVQFTVTDIGSDWVETGVVYDIRHKKKKIKIKDKIGIRLHKKLAKQKGLGPYGHTKSPGDFKGGKKTASEDKDKDKK